MTDNKASVNCGEALNISNAANLYDQLQKALEKSSAIELDAASVEKVDTAGLQVIVALGRELEKSGGSIVWKNPSDTLMQAATTLGLKPFLAIS
jgi:anti-anti-sigma factor